MERIISEKLEAYAAAHSTQESALFQKLVKETYQKTELPQMQVGHLEGAFLRMLVRLVRPKLILEIGTFTGYSALAMAEGLPPNGKIITCDINPQSTQIAKRHWSKTPHGKKISLKLGPALETIESIRNSIDMVFIDADKENYIRYWNACLPKLRAGGLIVADNVLWSGRVLNPKSDSDRAIVNFNKRVARDKRVEVVMLTIRDGITLAWKK
jgi:caffeoyl-CoA O-methyltransferase